MTNGSGSSARSPWWRIAAFASDLGFNPINWKTVLVGRMQFAFVMIVMAGWLVMIIRHPEKGMQVDVLWVVAGLLGGLSGITLAGRGVDRTTDYGYVERKYAGRVAVAQAVSQGPVPQVNTGDNASVNVTATMPVPGVAGGAAPRPSAAVMARPSGAVRAFDPGA